MPLDAEGRQVKLEVGHILTVDGCWFKVHKISRKDLVLRRLSEAHARRAHAAVKAVADARTKMEEARDNVDRLQAQSHDYQLL